VGEGNNELRKYHNLIKFQLYLPFLPSR
jgi:hypothetical protein